MDHDHSPVAQGSHFVATPEGEAYTSFPETRGTERNRSAKEGNPTTHTHGFGSVSLRQSERWVVMGLDETQS